MNITGTLETRKFNNATSFFTNVKGSFYFKGYGDSTTALKEEGEQSTNYIGFDASKNWTGVII